MGLESKGAIIEANFGQKPFIFDIQLKGELLFDSLCDSNDSDSNDSVLEEEDYYY